MGPLDLVDWPADRTLALSGSVGALRIPITLRNDSAEPALLAEASLAEVRLAGTGAPLRLQPVPVRMSVAGHGTQRTRLRLRLDPATPPGRYEGEVKLGGLARPVSIEVLPDVKLDIRPAPVVVDAALGREQTATVAFENRGNVPLTIDVSGSYPLAREAPVAADRLAATGQDGNPLAAILDKLTGREPSPALVPFGVIELAMPGGPAALAPGATLAAPISLKLPEHLSASARYHSFPPVYASDLHIVVVTAAKPPIAALSAPESTGAPA
jgi:hypothetical protein